MLIRPLAPVGRLSKQNGTGSRGMTRTDEELVARAQGGDVESFNQLIVRWERPIYALAYRVIGKEEDARDVCQDAFLRAYRALPGFKGQAKFSSWLYRIALNLCRDWIRRQRRAPVSQLPEDADAIELASETGPVESIEELVAVEAGDGAEALEADLLALIASLNRADDGTMVVPSEYLEAVLVKA